MRLIISKCIGCVLILMSGTQLYAAQCHFNVPDIDTNICQSDLNLNKSVEDNPFFMTNPNSTCGMSFSMPQLDDLNLSSQIPSYIKNPNLCGTLKALTGDQVISDIRSILG